MCPREAGWTDDLHAKMERVGNREPDMAQHPALPYLRSSEKGKVVTAADAVRLIGDGDTVATGGFIGTGFAEGIARGAGGTLPRSDEFAFPHATGKPRNLTLVYAAGQGDGKDRGMNHFGHEGLVRRVIGGHWGLAPKLADAGDRQQDRGLQPAARRHHPPVPRHRRAPPGASDPGRPRHFRRSAQRRRQDQRAHHRGPRRADHDPRRGGPALQMLPDRCRHHPRHHGGHARQHHHGARGADAGGAGDRHGGAQLRRRGDRAGRAPGRRRAACIRARSKIPGILVDCVVVAEKPEHHWPDVRDRRTIRPIPARRGRRWAPSRRCR